MNKTTLSLNQIEIGDLRRGATIEVQNAKGGKLRIKIGKQGLFITLPQKKNPERISWNKLTTIVQGLQEGDF